jgi:hypothetical protein
VKPEEIRMVLDSLKPEGLLLQTSCATESEAKELLSSLGWK